MKKLLIGTSALVAAGLVAGAAQAADPIKLSVGGFGHVIAGMASNDDDYEAAAGNDFATWDVKGNHEVIFSGATTLDNGLKVSTKMEFEGGGRSMTDPVDEYNITVAGSFGSVIAGSDDGVPVMMAKGHSDVSGLVNGFDEGDVLIGLWVAAPSAVSYLNSTYINTTGDAEKITYVSPEFAGFSFGVSATPAIDSTSGDAVGWPTDDTEDALSAGLQYTGDFGGVGLGVSAAYLTADSTAVDDWSEWQAGAQFSFAGLQVGGQYRVQNRDQVTAGASREHNAWEIGATYKTGPYGVSLGYFTSEWDNGAGVQDDEVTYYQLSGSYNMGPGVDMRLSVASIEFDDGATTQAAAPGNHNEGIASMLGLALSF